MSIPPSFLEEIRGRVAVSEVVGKRVRLTRKNREFSGLCPFHNEKTPSFTVNDEKGFYHCFGCGAHGDVLKFVIETEGLGFVEAVERLAGMAGLAMPAADPQAMRQAERRRGLEEAVEAACRWFQQQLAGHAGAAARDYLRRRGLDGETIARFRLGYAPPGREALLGHLRAAGFEEAVIVEAGLHRPADDGRDAIDYFRDRVMFPIADRRGRVVGFGGRVMGDGQPKYLNSPESALFHKGSQLYGLDQAREAAHRAGAVIAVEGYMDVIALSQAGFRHCVAPLGTALTEEQLEALWKLAAEPFLCFDGDAAGRRAAARAAERALALLKPGRSLRFVTLPGDAKDPDDLIRGGGPAAFQACLEAAEPLSDFLFRHELEAAPTDTPERIADLHARIGEQVRRIQDRLIRDLYQRHMADRLRQRFGGQPPAAALQPGRGDLQRGIGIGYDLREMEVRRGWPYRPRAPRPGAVAQDRLLPGRRAAMAAFQVPRREAAGILAALVNHPALIDRFEEDLAAVVVDDPALDRLRRAIVAALAEDATLDAAGLRRHLNETGFSDAVDAVANMGVYGAAPFARPAADPAEAERGLAERLGRWRSRRALDRQIEEAREAWLAEPNAQTLERMNALIEARRSLVGQPAAEEEPGQAAATGRGLRSGR
ncbi:MAG: DNA primase [Thalassobaculales bacterium]